MALLQSRSLQHSAWPQPAITSTRASSRTARSCFSQASSHHHQQPSAGQRQTTLCSSIVPAGSTSSSSRHLQHHSTRLCAAQRDDSAAAAAEAAGSSFDPSVSSSPGAAEQSVAPPAWAARMPTWSDATRKHLHNMMDLFTIADRDGNGTLDREEVRSLLQTDVRCTAGICLVAQHRWVSEEDLDEIMSTYDSSGKGGLTFNEFMELVLDGVLLDGTFDEYRAVFAAADENGDGALDLCELSEVLQQLGQPLTEEDVQRVMESADLDKNSVIDFNEFLRLFHTQLLDLPRLLRYIKMKPLVLGEEAPPASGMIQSLRSGSVTLVSAAAQWAGVMDACVAPTTLLVAMFGLSTDPVCQATAAAVQELAAVYRSAVFVRCHIDSSPEDKTLFKVTLLGRATPAFFFFRGGQLLHSHAAASPAVLEQHLREHLPARDQPVQPLFKQQQQQQQQAQPDEIQQQQQREQEEKAGAGQQPVRVAAACGGRGGSGSMGTGQAGGGAFAVGMSPQSSSAGAAEVALGLQQQQMTNSQQQQASVTTATTGFSMADLVYNTID